MINTNLISNSIYNKPYKLGFYSIVKKRKFPKGLNYFIILLISKKKKEPYFILNFRLKSYLKWKKSFFPTWSSLDIPFIDYKNILYFSEPLKKKSKNILKIFNKIGLLQENFLPKTLNIAVDAVFDSISIRTTFSEKLSKYGIIFCSISDAIKYYPFLVKKYLGSVVSYNDNYFASLNSAIFTDGSFCFVPQNKISPLSLSTYFRINDSDSGQFERTLIIAEKNAKIVYFEGCSAPKSYKSQLHAAVVELLANENAIIKYSTIQNWYTGNFNGIGGVLNFVTKRGICFGKNSEICWTQVETGSSITWKYPSCILIGDFSQGNFFSITLTKNYQQTDTGTKMIHLGKYTKSRIISKGISYDNSKNIYRGLVKISPTAYRARNYSQCDSFIIGSLSKSLTYPYFDIKNSTSMIEHEATISKISEKQLFYLCQKGLAIEQAVSILITGFCKKILEELPFEFVSEAKELLNLSLSI